jgi:peptidyl-prolyl cis-trans isomerase A (cyclophilin A)
MERRGLSRCALAAPAFLFVVTTLSVDRARAVAPPGETIVQFDTTLGSFQVELFDSVTPASVANFLNYVTSGRYDDTFVHRSAPGFVIQGGGFSFSNQNGPTPVPAFPPVMNEFNLSNTRGTLAVAKPGGNPNGGTSQWFINLVDNSALLDFQNGGQTVFGQVIGQGMTIVDAIAALPRVNAGLPFNEVPVVSPPSGPFQYENLVIVNNVSVVPEATSGALAAAAILLSPLRRRRLR